MARVSESSRLCSCFGWISVLFRGTEQRLATISILRLSVWPGIDENFYMDITICIDGIRILNGIKYIKGI